MRNWFRPIGSPVPNHSIRPNAEPFLFDYNFTIDSEYGTFTAYGADRLAIRINEINAIVALDEMKKTATFVEAAAKAALSPIGVAKDLVTKPVTTTKEVVKGVGDTGKSVIGGVRKRVKSVVSGDKQEKVQKTEYEDGALSEISGYSKIKREFSKELGVDPYSRNTILQGELREISRTAALGDIGVSAGVTFATSGATRVAIKATSASAELREMLSDMTPKEIRAMARNKMVGLGCSDEVIDTFLNHLQMLPTEKAFMVESAMKLAGASGMDTLFRLASQTQNEIDTVRFLRATRQLATPSADANRVTAIVDCSGVVAGITSDGRLIVPLTGANIAWIPPAEKVAEAVASFDGGTQTIGGRELHVSGEVTPTARKELGARGLIVVDGD